MRYLNIKNKITNASEIALGMMRISELRLQDIDALVKTAIDNGINFFDHADIYGGGKCEEMCVAASSARYAHGARRSCRSLSFPTAAQSSVKDDFLLDDIIIGSVKR